jgi:hypothetical protein
MFYRFPKSGGHWSQAVIRQEWYRETETRLPDGVFERAPYSLQSDTRPGLCHARHTDTAADAAKDIYFGAFTPLKA